MLLYKIFPLLLIPPTQIQTLRTNISPPLTPTPRVSTADNARPNQQRSSSCPIISEAITERTQSEHVRLLDELVEFVGGTNRTAVITGTDIARYLQQRHDNPRRPTESGVTKWTTIETIKGHIMGALRDAEFYGYTITYDPKSTEIRRMDHVVTKKAKATRVAFPKPANLQQVCQAFDHLIKMTPPTGLLAARYLTLWWTTAARPGDAIYLDFRDMRQQGNNGEVSIKFLKGKGVNLRGPYTVHTALPKPWMKHKHWILQDIGREIVPEDQVEHVQKLTLLALRKVDTELEARSIRRGAIQTLAAAGATDDTLMMFSGHKSVATLHRYLDWGLAHRGRQILGADTAATAWTNALQAGGHE